MDALVVMLKNVALFILLAVPGFLLTKAKILREKDSGILSKLLMYVGVPFLVFSGTADKVEFTKETAFVLAAVFLFGVLYTFLFFFLSGPLSAFEKDEKKRGMIRFSAVFSNNGFLGIPLALSVFGNGPVLTMVIVLNVLTNVLMNTLGVYLVSGDVSMIKPRKVLLHPVLLAFLLGILVNLTGIVKYVPEISTYSGHFSNVVTPVSMSVVGIKLASIRFCTLVKSQRNYYVSFLKLVLCPVLITAVLFCLRLAFPAFPLGKDAVLAFFIAFSMPTAGLASSFADAFQGDTEGAVTYTLGTTILSALTIPLLYFALTSILG